MGPTPTVAARKGKGIHVTREQKSILKDAFKFIPYPDHYPDSLEKLSADTGLDQEAIKKWFRNRRKKIGNKSATTDNDEEMNDFEDANDSGNVPSEEIGDVSQQVEIPVNDAVANKERNSVKSSDNVDSAVEDKKDASDTNVIDPVFIKNSVAASESDVIDIDASATEDVEEKGETMEKPTANPMNLGNLKKVHSTSVSDEKQGYENDAENKARNIPQDMKFVESGIPLQEISKIDEVPPIQEEAKMDKISEDDPNLNESKGIGEMSTAEKAAKYDELKQEFSNLQNRFESLAKILGSHGIDIGDTNLAPAQPSTSQQPSTEVPVPEVPPSAYPPQSQVPNSHPGEQFVPKQEPQSYGWDYNHQAYNQHWQQYPPYPPTQMYPGNYSNPFAPQPYNLPYPPPDTRFHPPQPVHQAAPVHDIPPPYPADESTMNRPSSTTHPVAASRPSQPVETNPANLVDPVDGTTNQNFKGDIAAPKKSFQGPSNKLKRKSLPPANHAKPAQPPQQVKQTPPPVPTKRPRAQTTHAQTSQVFPTSIDLAGQSLKPALHQRRKSLPMKTKLGACPKPSPKKVPLLEQSLQANNPFRSNKQSVNSLKRQPPPVSPEIQTLFPPIQNLRGLQQKQARSPDIEYVSTERRKSLPGARLPNLGSGISIQKVYNPLNDPNKPQELKKVLAMTNLSVSLARK